MATLFGDKSIDLPFTRRDFHDAPSKAKPPWFPMWVQRCREVVATWRSNWGYKAPWLVMFMGNTLGFPCSNRQGNLTMYQAYLTSVASLWDNSLRTIVCLSTLLHIWNRRLFALSHCPFQKGIPSPRLFHQIEGVCKCICMHIYIYNSTVDRLICPPRKLFVFPWTLRGIMVSWIAQDLFTSRNIRSSR